MQKRHYRKGWTINWRTSEKTEKAQVKEKDTFHIENTENMLSSVDENLTLALEESKIHYDTFRIEQSKSNPLVEKSKIEKIYKKFEEVNSRTTFKIEKDKAVKNGKKKGIVFFVLAFITFIVTIFAIQFLTPDFLYSIGFGNFPLSRKLIIVLFIVLLILFLFFIIYGIIQRRNFKDVNQPLSLKAQRLIKREEKRSRATELKVVGIVNRTKLWLLLAGIIVVIAIAALFLIEDGGILAIMAILPFIAFICVAILEFFRYKKNAKAYEQGEYDPDKFLNRTKKKKT